MLKVQHAIEWKFSVVTWKTDHTKTHTYMWLILKGLMEAEIMTYCNGYTKDTASLGHPLKKAKANGPIGMELVAQEFSRAVKGITSVQFAEAPPVRTHSDKQLIDHLTQQAKENAKANTQFGRLKKRSFKNGGGEWKSASNTPNTQHDCDSKPENSGEFSNQAGNEIECFLCKKMGVELPASNHVYSNCKDAKDHVSKTWMSVPTHQQHENPLSKQYVPPSCMTGQHVGFGNVAMECTPAITGSQMASIMFGMAAQSATDFALSAFSSPGKAGLRQQLLCSLAARKIPPLKILVCDLPVLSSAC